MIDNLDVTEMNEILTHIAQQRQQILEDFGIAYLSAMVPDSHLKHEWVMEHLELVERKSEDGLETSWSFRLKKPSEKA